MSIGSDMPPFVGSLLAQLGEFVPRLVGGILVLVLGWVFATLVAQTALTLLKKTNLDNRLGQWITGGQEGVDAPKTELWISQSLYWITMLFVVVGFLQALGLEVVSGPLDSFLREIFAYVPRIGGAALLLAVAWLMATLSRLLLTRGLARFQLDDRLAEQTGTTKEESPFLVNEALGNLLYWFIFLFFLPLVLEALALEGSSIEPVQAILEQILLALPRILRASIYAGLGWLLARVVRGIVTNLLAAAGADRMGSQFGLSTQEGQATISSLVGNLVYVLILIPTAIAALDALAIESISDPAIEMLEQVSTVIPQIFAAGLIIVLFYFIGRFLSTIVTQLLTTVGFNRVWTWLGLTASQGSTDPVETAIESGQMTRTPSEIVGIIVLVGIMLFGAVPATEVLQFQTLTDIVEGLLAVSARVLVGAFIFGIGLYLANLAFNLICSFQGSQARVLAQAARVSIWVFVGAMALQQMGVATDIVVLAFGLILGAIAVAIALAFGLGGRDVAAERIRAWLETFEHGSGATGSGSSGPSPASVRSEFDQGQFGAASDESVFDQGLSTEDPGSMWE